MQELAMRMHDISKKKSVIIDTVRIAVSRHLINILGISLQCHCFVTDRGKVITKCSDVHTWQVFRMEHYYWLFCNSKKKKRLVRELLFIASI